MTDTAIIERDVVVPAASEAGRTPFSWSAAIAGAFAATAVTFIIVALGSGIGLSFASPYGSGASATSLTIGAAVWLVMAQTMGFAAGGYLAGRLRSPAYDGVIGETTFRDAAEGLVVWAIGVVAITALAGALGFLRLRERSPRSATRRARRSIGSSSAALPRDALTTATAPISRKWLPPAQGFHRTKRSAASPRWSPRHAMPPIRPLRPAPICRSGLSWRSCSVARPQRSPACSADRCATPKAARRNEHEMRGASCST